MVFKITCLTVLVLGLAQAGVLPVEKCTLGDSVCLKPAFEKMLPIFVGGIPDANVDILDPLEMDDLNSELAGLKFSLKEGRMKGFKTSVIDGVQWSKKKNMFTVDLHLDTSIRGHYTAAGQILILPISGDGVLKLKFKNLQIKLNINYDIVKGADGKDHVKPKKYTYDFDVKDNAHFNLTNLFNGKKEPSDAMLTFLNTNWKQIVSGFGKPLLDVITKQIYKNIVNFFDALPIEDIANV